MTVQGFKIVYHFQNVYVDVYLIISKKFTKTNFLFPFFFGNCNN